MSSILISKNTKLPFSYENGSGGGLAFNLHNKKNAVYIDQEEFIGVELGRWCHTAH